MIPSKFADVSAKYHTAWVAVITTAVIAIVAEFLYSYLGYSSYFTMGTVLWGNLIHDTRTGPDGLPVREEDLFAQAPGWLGKKVVGIPIVSIIGGVTMVGFGYVGAVAFSSPAVTVVNADSLELLVGLIILGFVIYFASNRYHKRKGLDISMALKEIPPE